MYTQYNMSVYSEYYECILGYTAYISFIAWRFKSDYFLHTI